MFTVLTVFTVLVVSIYCYNMYSAINNFGRCFSKSPLGAHRVCGDAAKAHGSVDSPHPEELSGNDVVTVTAPNGSSSLYAGKTPVSG